METRLSTKIDMETGLHTERVYDTQKFRELYVITEGQGMQIRPGEGGGI